MYESYICASAPEPIPAQDCQMILPTSQGAPSLAFVSSAPTAPTEKLLFSVIKRTFGELVGRTENQSAAHPSHRPNPCSSAVARKPCRATAIFKQSRATKSTGIVAAAEVPRASTALPALSRRRPSPCASGGLETRRRVAGADPGRIQAERSLVGGFRP